MIQRMRNWLYDYRMANIDARERQRKQDQLFDEVHEMRRLLEQQK